MQIPKIDHMLSSLRAWPLRSLFPELSESQFRVAALYALGTGNQETARICGMTEGAVKSALVRSRDALNLEELASLRTLFNCRMLAGLYATLAETPSKSRPTGIC
ncbi:sigma factor-like helix-turn-helix DNA-binding protein [Serratia liquefaciens]|uniref:sigma factor-like helix-turn-helix DNA-binding protein n=1 Tax=Serratia liquefaciens TaxID=614 RepID=UPI0039062C53